MKRNDWKACAVAAAAGVLCGAAGLFPAWAAQAGAGEVPQAGAGEVPQAGAGEVPQIDIGETAQADGIDGSPGDLDDLDGIIEEYFRQVDSGQISAGDQAQSEMIENPHMEMSLEDGGMIRYTLPNGCFFGSSVPNGMITEKPVDLVLMSGTVGVVSKDDGLASPPEEWHFTEPGVYHVTLLSYLMPSGDGKDYNVYEVDYWFVIAGEADGRLGALPAPEGFHITGAKRDGLAVKEFDPACLFLERDGLYEIFYEDDDGRGIRLATRFLRDTTAPFLTFSKDLSRGPVTAPVQFSPSEPESRIYMGYNGNKSYAPADTLTAAGSYELEIRDPAGNSRTYHLRIRQVYRLIDVRMIVMALLILCAAAARLLYLRRNMRVL